MSSDLRMGTVVSPSGVRTIRQDGATTAMPVSYLVPSGASLTAGERVLWTVVDGRVVVFVPQDVS